MAKGDMNPWVKRKWVKALLSGEYKQAVGELFGEDDGEVDGYCCLAVLMAEMHPSSFDGRDKYFPERIDVGDDQAEGKVADDLAILWGLDEEMQETLAELNDNGRSFEFIANVIEREL